MLKQTDLGTSRINLKSILTWIDFDFQDPNQDENLCGSVNSVIIDHDLSDKSESENNQQITSESLWVGDPSNRNVSYWQVMKIVKFINLGNQNITSVMLAILIGMDLNNLGCQQALVDTHGLEIIINLLEVPESNCQRNAIRIIGLLAKILHMRQYMLTLGVITPILNIIESPVNELSLYAVYVLALLAIEKQTRTIVSENIKIIRQLVTLIIGGDIRKNLYCIPIELREAWHLGKASTKAVALLSKSSRIQEILFETGIVKICEEILTSPDKWICLSTLIILANCTSMLCYIQIIGNYRHLKFVAYHLKHNNNHFKTKCSKIIYNCAVNNEIAKKALNLNFMEYLTEILKKQNTINMPYLVKYTAGAIWRLCNITENLNYVHQKKIIPCLVYLFINLRASNAKINVLRAMCLLTSFLDNAEAVFKNDGIPPLINILNLSSDYRELTYSAQIIRNCAHHTECLKEMAKKDIIRVMWSNLSINNTMLQASAAHALVPLIKGIANSNEIIRSFVGGIEILLSLLDSEDVTVIAAACEAIAEVANDDENLMVATELGIIPKLCKLILMKHEKVQEYLDLCISRVARIPTNCFNFGKNGCIASMVLKSPSSRKYATPATALSLWTLSLDSINCITLQKFGVVTFLLKCMSSNNLLLQKAAKGCLSNLRKLMYKADLSKNFGTVQIILSNIFQLQ